MTPLTGKPCGQISHGNIFREYRLLLAVSPGRSGIKARIDCLDWDKAVPEHVLKETFIYPYHREKISITEEREKEDSAEAGK